MVGRMSTKSRFRRKHKTGEPMKKMIVTLALFAVFAGPALASESVVCTLTTATGAAASTASCTTGSATWTAGSRAHAVYD